MLFLFRLVCSCDYGEKIAILCCLDGALSQKDIWCWLELHSKEYDILLSLRTELSYLISHVIDSWTNRALQAQYGHVAVARRM